MIRFVMGMVAALGVLIGAVLLYDDGRASSSEASHPGAAGELLTAEVVTGRIRRTVSAIGRLEAVVMVEVSSQLSGQILGVQADFNDVVAAGEILAQLDSRGYEARVVQAEAEARMAEENVAILEAKLEKARGIEQESVAQRRVFAARIDAARLTLTAAARHLDRATKLADRGSGAVATVEEAQTALDLAAVTLREVEARASAHEHAVASSEAGRAEVEAELANAEAALPYRNAALALARLDLERSTIRSPVDGVVVSRNVEVGQTVAVSLDAPVLFTIAGDLSELEIDASIDEADIGEVAVGQPATFTVDAFPQRTFAAEVRQIQKVPKVLEGVVTYTVVLHTTNADGILLPGMTAVVRIVVEETGDVPTVPLTALGLTADGTRSAGAEGGVVWVLGDTTAPEPRRVGVGAEDGTDIAVTSGELRPGERVVIGRRPHLTERRFLGIAY